MPPQPGVNGLAATLPAMTLIAVPISVDDTASAHAQAARAAEHGDDYLVDPDKAQASVPIACGRRPAASIPAHAA